jgi:hypothetical protein
MREQLSHLASAVAAAVLLGAPPSLPAQDPPPLTGPALAIRGGFSVVVPSETDELEWQIAYGAGFEYAL